MLKKGRCYYENRNLGIIGIVLEFHFELDGMIGFLLIWLGTVFIGIGIFKGNNPLKVIAKFISELF